MNSTVDNASPLQADPAQLLIQLLVGSGMVSRDELSDFKNIARDLKVPLIQAMTSSGSLDKASLQVAAEALNRVQQKQVSLDLAIRALRISIQQKISIAEAINAAQKLHKTTRIFLSATNELTSLLTEAEIISQQQLGKLLVKSHESSMMIGQVVCSEGILSVQGLLAALQTTRLIKEQTLTKADGVRALKHSITEGITIEQALFELELFSPPDSKLMRMEELFLMAKAITLQVFV
jgi:hypothetical protein